MASNVEYPTTSDDEESLEDEKTSGGSFRNGEFQGRLFKWTNYLHGWQERYLVLRHGFFNYYKNEFDITVGCRGALSVQQAVIQVYIYIHIFTFQSYLLLFSLMNLMIVVLIYVLVILYGIYGQIIVRIVIDGCKH